jgi:hypothetical protein
MKNRINIKIIPKVNLQNFNQIIISLKDVNPKIKLEKRIYYYPQTTSSY